MWCGEDGVEAGESEVLRLYKGIWIWRSLGYRAAERDARTARAPKKWGSTSILSLAIGQEVGVTPVQLVTMVSALANGGVYMPPHVLLKSD